METKKTLIISLTKAKELYENGNEDIKSLLLETFKKEELETRELPKTWVGYCENNYRKGYYLSEGSTVRAFTKDAHNSKLNFKSDKNTFESKENAEAVLALCQLIRLRDEYNGHKPIVNINKDPYTIEYDTEHNYYDIIPIDIDYSYKSLFVFHNKELAQEFLKNFRPLLDKFYKIMY